MLRPRSVTRKHQSDSLLFSSPVGPEKERFGTFLSTTSSTNLHTLLSPSPSSSPSIHIAGADEKRMGAISLVLSGTLCLRSNTNKFIRRTHKNEHKRQAICDRRRLRRAHCFCILSLSQHNNLLLLLFIGRTKDKLKQMFFFQFSLFVRYRFGTSPCIEM